MSFPVAVSPSRTHFVAENNPSGTPGSVANSPGWLARVPCPVARKASAKVPSGPGASLEARADLLPGSRGLLAEFSSM